jgi:hypothetical protein
MTEKHERKALIEILRQAHQEKQKVEIGDHWQQELMDRIREFGPIEMKPSLLLMFQQLVWRLVPATCVLILGLTLLLSAVSFVPGNDALQLLMNGTEELTLVQFLEP